MAKFKVGDRVKIRRDITTGIYYGSVYLHHNLVGKEFTVKEVHEHSDFPYYLVVEGSGEHWEYELFEKIDSEQNKNLQPSKKISHILESLNKLLQEKNKRYGNSALEPLGIFNKGDSTDGILIRLDDKLQRIKNSTELRKNDVADIMGYLTLLCVSKGWDDFSELID